MKYTAKTSHKLPFALKLLCSCALMFLCSSTSVRAGTLPNTAKLIPPETILLVDVDDFDRLRTQFEETNFYKLCNDPAMAAFVDDFKVKWQQHKHKWNHEFDKIIANIDVWPQGRVTIALVINDQTIDANDPPFLVITQWGKNISKIKESVDKTVEKAIEDGAHRRTEDYRGVSITTITTTAEPPKVLSYCFTDDCLLASFNPDVLKFVIAHIEGAQSPTLADDTDYTATMKAVQSSGERIDIYVNIKQIVKTIIAEDDTGKTKTMMRNLGLDNVTSFGCSIGPGPSTGGSKASFGKAFLKVKGEKKGICKMLDIESAAFRAPPFVPTSAYSVSFVNLNIKKAYNELGNILSSISPQLAAIMYMPLLPPSPQGEPPLQLKTDIVGHLGSQIIIAQSISEPPSGADKPGPRKSVIAVAMDNRSALEKSLSLLHSKILAANNPDARRQLLGHTIYLVDLSAMLPTPSKRPKRPMQALAQSEVSTELQQKRWENLLLTGPVGPMTQKMPEKAAFTVTDTHLIFAGESAVEQVIRALSGTENVSVDSAQWFNKAKSTIPSVVGLASLQNYAASGEFFWSELRELKKQTSKSKGKDSSTTIGVEVSSASPFPQFMFSQAGSDLFDFSLLPEFDAVRKYFGLSAFYGLSRPDGFFFEFKYLNPHLDN